MRDRDKECQLRILLKTKPCDAAAMVAAGMIAKRDLVDGATYIGFCRNSTEAVWHVDKQRFTYMRTKFRDTFPEDINHPEDDDGFDLFVPIKLRDLVQ